LQKLEEKSLLVNFLMREEFIALRTWYWMSLLGPINNFYLICFYCIGKALDKALEQSCELFKKHGRHSARKVLIVFTNGKSNARANELKKNAQNLTDLNVKLIVVAIGDDVSVEELLEVTSNEESIVRTQPDDDHETLFASIVRVNIEGTCILS
jgi:hypothetical protein